MAKFTNFRTNSNWVDGEEGDYKFQAKLYDVGSSLGIGGGRVSKLWIGTKQNEAIIHYDRGWDTEPENDQKEVFHNVMDLLENSPKRFGDE